MVDAQLAAEVVEVQLLYALAYSVFSRSSAYRSPLE